MADIFVSYAHADRERVAALGDALEAEGYSVWWDRQIESGSEFSAQIERELAAATHVLVCWSAQANQSNWVKDEATVAARANKLKAISLDGCEPPMGYMQFHAVDFSNWAGDSDDEAFHALKGALSNRPRDASHPSMVSAPTQSARSGRLRMVAALVLAVVAGAYLWNKQADRSAIQAATQRAPDGAEQSSSYQSIAVMAFADLSEDRDQEYFSDGISEELLNLLARETPLRVASRTSSFFFKGKTAQVSEIGAALNVDTVLEGSVRKAGDKVRITVQLADAKTGESLWANQFDRELTDIFAVQDEVARAIVQSLQATTGTGSSIQTPSTDPETYDLYLRAKYQFELRGQGIATAAALTEQATTRDPNFAPAWALRAMAEMYSFRSGTGKTKGEYVQSAKPFIDRSLTLNPRLAEGHVALAYYQQAQGDTDAAVASYRQAIAINPAASNARHLLYISLNKARAWRESFAVIDEAKVADPLSPSVASNYVSSLLRRDRKSEALIEARHLAERFPDYTHGKVVLSLALRFNGELAQAARVLVLQWQATQRPRFQMQSAIHLVDLKITDFELPAGGQMIGNALRQLLEGNPEQATEMLLAARNDNPSRFAQDGWAGELLWWTGNETQAYAFFEAARQREQLDRLVARDDDCGFALTAGALFRRAGKHQVADPIIADCRTILESQRSENLEQVENPDEFAQLQMLLGDHDAALLELERLAANQWLYFWWFKFNPIYEPLKDNPRFQSVVYETSQKTDMERAKYLALEADESH